MDVVVVREAGASPAALVVVAWCEATRETDGRERNQGKEKWQNRNKRFVYDEDDRASKESVLSESTSKTSGVLFFKLCVPLVVIKGRADSTPAPPVVVVRCE